MAAPGNEAEYTVAQSQGEGGISDMDGRAGRFGVRSCMIGGTTDDRGSGRVRADGGVVPLSSTSLTEGVLETMFLTKLKAGAVVLLAIVNLFRRGRVR